MTVHEVPANLGRRLSTAARVFVVVVAAALLIAVAVPIAGFVRGPDVASSFTPTGSMTRPRSEHVAVLLGDGRVLIAGGLTTGLEPTATAELYDPKTGTFAATGSMSQARTLFTATPLRDGRVLIAGGLARAHLASAEIYDPATGRFTQTGPMGVARDGHTATLLPDGSVLVAGGLSGDQIADCQASAEIYDPATGRFHMTGAMSSARYLHTATLLGSGQVLVAAGQCGGGTMGTAELFDPASGSFRVTGSMAQWHIANDGVPLADGRAAIGGNGWIEVFDPARGVFSPGHQMLSPRSGNHAVGLRNGAILLTGGSRNICCDQWENFPSGELYFPSTDSSQRAGSMVETRANDTATLLPDGRVLLAGGESPSGGRGVLASAELFALK